MDAVYPAAASALARGRRARRSGPRLRHRTAPVTFAEIEEVDEDKEVELEETRRGSSSSLAAAGEGGSGGAGSSGGERRRRPDLLDERLDREFAAFRRRRARRQPLREPDEPEPPPAPLPRPADEDRPAPPAPSGSDAP